jgi:hypothetical protein
VRDHCTRNSANALDEDVRSEFAPRRVTAHGEDECHRRIPPGKIITFRAVEVQVRTQQQVEVIAARRTYDAPGLIGLPPLIGCWDRPDNIVWIMPAGDTGCGLWRWFTWGGDRHWHDADVEWVYRYVFT